MMVGVSKPRRRRRIHSNCWHPQQQETTRTHLLKPRSLPIDIVEMFVERFNLSFVIFWWLLTRSEVIIWLMFGIDFGVFFFLLFLLSFPLCLWFLFIWIAAAASFTKIDTNSVSIWNDAHVFSPRVFHWVRFIYLCFCCFFFSWVNIWLLRFFFSGSFCFPRCLLDAFVNLPTPNPYARQN